MDRMRDRVVLVTGAARGQGREHALAFAREGADVIAVDACAPESSAAYDMATLADLEETAAMVRELDRRIVAARVDVRNFGALRTAVDSAVDELGRLDVVVANAGFISAAPLLDMSEDAWDDVVAVNLSGVWRTCKAATPHLLAGGRGGSLLLISSVAGLKGFGNVANYVAAKHGLVGLMRSLAQELSPHGIRVNTISPTQVDTDMIMNSTQYKLFRPDLEDPQRADFASASQSTHLLPVPWLEARDVSNAALFLASDDARYITGITLPVDAGALTR